jgi:hypothetical protein
MVTSVEKASNSTAEARMTFEDFLTKTPVLKERRVGVEISGATSSTSPHFELPVLRLFCNSVDCSGVRHFDPIASEFYLSDVKQYRRYDKIVYYRCRNCNSTIKTYALRLYVIELKAQGIVDVTKIGEVPAFGLPHPDAIKDVLGDAAEYFDPGYQSETAGLGIGAFAYYRRFVENHKDKIIGAIRSVAVAQGADESVIKTLDRATSMNSFANAVDVVKDAIPDSLRHSGGHNPLTLLHDLLSDGLHNDNDDECLKIAQDIRLLLTDLSERTTQALTRKNELTDAVNRMLKRKSEKARKQAEPTGA